MGFKSPQTRPGTSTIHGGNNKSGSKGRSDGTDKLTGPRSGDRITTHYPRKSSSNPNDGPGPGRKIEGQNLRGFVQAAKSSAGNIKSANVADDGTRRLREL